jgi:hypothetical protein
LACAVPVSTSSAGEAKKGAEKAKRTLVMATIKNGFSPNLLKRCLLMYANNGKQRISNTKKTFAYQGVMFYFLQ